MNAAFYESMSGVTKIQTGFYEHFYQVKNLEGNVITPSGIAIKKEMEQKSYAKGSKAITGNKYLLTSSRRWLKERHKIAEIWEDEGSKEHLFNGVQKKTPKGGRAERYQELLHLNEDLW